MSEYRKTSPGNLYFVTLTVQGWIDIFTRPVYKDIIINNLIHCRQNEGLEIYEYVLMGSHLHMIAARKDELDLGELLGRFKSFTAKQILATVTQNPAESRKEWLLYMFEHFAKKNKQHREHQFWQYTNHPIELYTAAVIQQKVDYIHNNPVVEGIVSEPHHYLYSSACPLSPIKVLEL